MPALADFRLSAAQRRALAALARVSCPPDIEELHIVDAVVDHCELSLRSLPPLIRTGLVTVLAAYENGARPFHGGRPASALPFAEGHRWFERWRKSPLLPMREWVKGAKGLLCMAYYEQPQVKDRIGYTPEAWIEKVKRKRLALYSDEIRRHEQSLIQPDPLPLDRLFGPQASDLRRQGSGSRPEARGLGPEASAKEAG
jgi:hypothetical protein